MAQLNINGIVYIGLHHAVVMDVVFSKARSSLLSKLLNADGIVLMAPTMD